MASRGSCHCWWESGSKSLCDAQSQLIALGSTMKNVGAPGSLAVDAAVHLLKDSTCLRMEFQGSGGQ